MVLSLSWQVLLLACHCIICAVFPLEGAVVSVSPGDVVSVSPGDVIIVAVAAVNNISCDVTSIEFPYL